jgi:iron complex transport system ATP-binding protein
MSRLTARGVVVRYNGRTAVGGVDLEVAAGEWVSIIGPNGAGKSSLLRALAGVIPHEGSIRIGDHELSSLRRRQVAQMVAVVPQHPERPDGMRVADYALLGRSPHLSYLAVETDADRDIVAGVLDRLDASDLADRRLGTLSGGEWQRVVLARALVQEPEVLLLDEPTTSLDVGHAQQVFDLVEDLRVERQISVLAAIHDLTMAGQYSDRLVCMDGGLVIADGPPRSVLTEAVLMRFSGARVTVVDGPGGEVIVAPRRRP